MNKEEKALELINRIDFKDLKEQKIALLKIMPEGETLLDGIIALIDGIQDFAVDVLGKDELEVFHLTNVGSITHNGIDYPTRTMIVDYGDGNTEITISVESLESTLDLDTVEDETLDNSIYFYVSDDLIEKRAEEICEKYLDEAMTLVEEIL